MPLFQGNLSGGCSKAIRHRLVLPTGYHDTRPTNATHTARGIFDRHTDKQTLNGVMKIVIDDKIPYIREAISRITDDAVYKKGAEINAQDVKDADALIVRTRTRCDEQLLRGSKVSFVATATIGYDHIDTAYMQQAGIRWMNCPGCNASSVAQYVGAVLALLQRDKGITLNQSTIGVVGCGHVGSKVAQVARREGMKVLLCDPPRAEREGQGHFVDLPTIAREADIITFHVPLTREGNHTTWHLADQAFFNSLQRRPVVINSSRGAVVDNHALLHALIYNKVREAVVDTWENEPRLLLPLLQRVWIGTPHIAGYSADGKVNADNMVVEALCRHFNLPCPPRITPPALPHPFTPSADPHTRLLQYYNPLADSQKLKQHPQAFEQLRGEYPVRREEQNTDFGQKTCTIWD